MKKLLLNFGFLVLIGISPGWAQLNDYLKANMSPETEKMITEAKACQDSDSQNCSTLFRAAIKKGKKEKAAYLDYLYFQYAFYLYRTNQSDSSMYYVDKALANENPKDYDTHAAAVNLKGTLFYSLGENVKAIDHLIQASKILEENKDSVKLAYSFINIGTLVGSADDNKTAMDYYMKAYNILTALKDSSYLGTLAGNIGSKYFERSDWGNSKIWAHRAMKFENPRDPYTGKSSGAHILSLLFTHENNLDSAYYYGQKAVEYAEKTEQPYKIGSALYAYAVALNNKGMKSEARKNIDEAISVLSDIGEKETLVKALGIAAEIYADGGDYKKASEYYAEYKKLYESLLPEQTAKIVSELNTQYETEKKEKQIAEQELKIQKHRSNLWLAILGGALLASILGGAFWMNRRTNRLKLSQLQQEKENAILNSFIQGEERERNRISHELHDGVAAMIGAAKMGLEAIPHLKPEQQLEQYNKVKTILNTTHADVRHIAHNLLPTVLENDGLIKATEHFIGEINQTGLLKVSVADNNSGAEKLPEQMQLLLFRVIQELVNNIIKHSQAQTAKISFSRSANGLNIEVTDDGIGFDGGLDSGNQGLYSISQRLKSIGGNFKFIKGERRGMSAIAEVKI